MSRIIIAASCEAGIEKTQADGGTPRWWARRRLFVTQKNVGTATTIARFRTQK
jgi:hypothetical protein